MVARISSMRSATEVRREKKALSKREEKLAEGVGFEPTRLSPAGFQDRCTRPLCEPSVGEATRIFRSVKIGPNYREEITYSGSSRSFSITIATPSWLCGGATSLALAGPA